RGARHSRAALADRHRDLRRLRAARTLAAPCGPHSWRVCAATVATRPTQVTVPATVEGGPGEAGLGGQPEVAGGGGGVGGGGAAGAAVAGGGAVFVALG